MHRGNVLAFHPAIPGFYLPVGKKINPTKGTLFLQNVVLSTKDKNPSLVITNNLIDPLNTAVYKESSSNVSYQTLKTLV